MKVKVAATQMTCSWELEDNINKAKNIIKNAANQGANIILLQELFQTPYFCIEYDENIFRLAKEFENHPLLGEMADISK
jgi:N-carbamoylputrescine amidase